MHATPLAVFVLDVTVHASGNANRRPAWPRQPGVDEAGGHPLHLMAVAQIQAETLSDRTARVLHQGESWVDWMGCNLQKALHRLWTAGNQLNSIRTMDPLPGTQRWIRVIILDRASLVSLERTPSWVALSKRRPIATWQ